MQFAELLMQDAARRGLKHVFGIPGSGFPMDAIEAGRKAGVDFVHVAHESTAAIAAAYYGAMLDAAGLAIGVKGVGAGNMVGGIANAYFERMPLVAVFEAGPSNSDIDLVQVADHRKMFGSVTKAPESRRGENQGTLIRARSRQGACYLRESAIEPYIRSRVRYRARPQQFHQPSKFPARHLDSERRSSDRRDRSRHCSTYMDRL